MKFGLDANANFRSEGTAPFALFGDSNGNYNAGAFALGSHIITATPFSTTGGDGHAGTDAQRDVLGDQPASRHESCADRFGRHHSECCAAEFGQPRGERDRR